MKHFTSRQIDEALAWAAGGGQALHTHTFIVNVDTAPGCFLSALARGESVGHLFDLDEARLVATARRLGVRVIRIDRPGTGRQHVDLCGGPLRRALAECLKEGEP